MAPHFRFPGEKKKKKKKTDSEFTWFETTVNGGAVVLALLRDAASLAPLPYLRGAAATTLSIIQIAQTVKDNRDDFRRLCEDTATLTVVVYDSRQRSEDPDGWPGPGLKDSVDSFLSTLNMIAEFARSQVDRARFIRVMNSVGDGNKIREFRERLAQAMNRFEVSAHLQSYEILRMIKNMMEDYKNRLNEQVAASQEAKEDETNRPLPAVPSYPDEQLLRDEEFAKSLEAADMQIAERDAEQEARKKEQEAVNEKLQQILLMLENRPEPGQSSNDKGEHKNSSSDEESILKVIMKNAAEKKADRDSKKKDRDDVLKLGNSHASSARNPYSDIASLQAGVSNLRMTSKNSGNVNTSMVIGSHNDNSTVTQITKTK